MTPDQPILDLSFVEQLDHMWARDIEHLGGLLRGQLGMRRDDRDTLPGSHIRQHIPDQLECCTWQM